MIDSEEREMNYQFGKTAAMAGEIHDFVKNRDYYDNDFVNGYMAVLQGVYNGWGDAEHNLHMNYRR